MTTIVLPYRARHRAPDRAPTTLQRQLLTLLAAFVALFAVSVAAGWRLAGGQFTAASVSLPSADSVKVLLAAAVIAFLARRITWS